MILEGWNQEIWQRHDGLSQELAALDDSHGDCCSKHNRLLESIGLLSLSCHVRSCSNFRALAADRDLGISTRGLDQSSNEWDVVRIT